MSHIPVHQLSEGTSLGLQLKRFERGVFSSNDDKVIGVHRDDHYLFFVLAAGTASINIDFQEMPLPAPCIFYVLPSQVHQRICGETASGWFVAVDTGLVPPECREVFEGSLFLQQPQVLNNDRLRQCRDLLTLLWDQYDEVQTGTFAVMALHALLRSFLAVAAACYDGSSDTDTKVSRPVQLTARFRDLLRSELRTLKGPAEFAARLHISETYLSEVLKKTTGFPASYWIQQEVMMEAKRLLSYSQLSVKEIAHELGYEDHSYFSRLFRKVTGVPAMTFRDQYRK